MTNEIITQMDNLVHKRFNKKTLEKKLSTIFNEDIKITQNNEDVGVSDWLFEFSVKSVKYDFDIYFLYHRGKRKGWDGSQFLVTEWHCQKY